MYITICAHAPPYPLGFSIRCARREHYTVLLYYPRERHHASLGVLLDVAVHLVRVRGVRVRIRVRIRVRVLDVAVHHHPAQEGRDEADGVGQRAVERQCVAPV